MDRSETIRHLIKLLEQGRKLEFKPRTTMSYRPSAATKDYYPDYFLDNPECYREVPREAKATCWAVVRLTGEHLSQEIVALYTAEANAVIERDRCTRNSNYDYIALELSGSVEL